MSKRCIYGADSLDRISNLPDHILSHILLFLPTKDAVATHILSKSWSFVWTAISNLDFRYPAAHHSLISNDFVDFVNYVLLLHKTSRLIKFSLTLQTESVPSNVEAGINSWICSAIARNVDHLSLSAANNFKLPIQTHRVILGCEGLRSLELNCNISISSDTMVSLPKLESLKLTSIDCNSKEAFSKLVGGCPVLKYLLVDLRRDKLCKYVIPSTSLRHLELCSHNLSPQRRGGVCLVWLEAPSLEYIKIQDQLSFILTKPRLNSLVEASIQLPNLDALNRFRKGCHLVVFFIQLFTCAKVLTL